MKSGLAVTSLEVMYSPFVRFTSTDPVRCRTYLNEVIRHGKVEDRSVHEHLLACAFAYLDQSSPIVALWHWLAFLLRSVLKHAAR